MAIETQWDIGNSSLSLTDRLMSVMKAATIDDVQPGALLAAEALGGSLVVSPSMISKAVDVLGGDQSVKIEQLRLTIGLSSGGVSAQIRQSLTMTKTFLLIVGLKLGLDENEAIGDFLFQLIAQSGCFEFLLVSRTQLEGLVDCLNGQTETFIKKEGVPEKILDPIIEPLASFSNTHRGVDFFAPLSSDSMPSIILHIFKALGNDRLHHLVLRGHQAAVWLCALITCLTPTALATYVDDRLVFGSADAKIRVSITPAIGWQLEDWYEEDRVESAITSMKTEGLCAPEPRTSILRHLAYQYWLVEWSDIGSSASAAAEVAVAVVHVALELLTLCGNDDSHCTSLVGATTFKDVCPLGIERKAKDFPHSFGWPHALDDSAITALAKVFKGHIELLKNGGLDDPLTAAVEAVGTAFGTGYKLSELSFDIGCQMAESFIFEATLSDERLRIDLLKFGRSWEKSKIMQALWFKRQVPVDDYIDWCYAYTEPGSALKVDTLDGNRGLIVSAAGYVAFPSSLIGFSRSKKSALSLTVLPGKLFWKDEVFSRLTEVASTFEDPSYPPREEIPLLKLTSPHLESQLFEVRHLKVKTLLSRAPHTLKASWEMVCDSTYRKTFSQSFGKARKRLALSTEADVDPAINLETLKDLRIPSIMILGPMDWLFPRDSDGSDPARPFRAVTTYSRCNEAGFLAAGSVFDHLPLVSQGNASLLESIVFAERTFGDHWVIINSL